MRFEVLKVLVIVMGMGLLPSSLLLKTQLMPKSKKLAQTVNLVRLMLSLRILAQMRRNRSKVRPSSKKIMKRIL